MGEDWLGVPREKGCFGKVTWLCARTGKREETIGTLRFVLISWGGCVHHKPGTLPKRRLSPQARWDYMVGFTKCRADTVFLFFLFSCLSCSYSRQMQPLSPFGVETLLGNKTRRSCTMTRSQPVALKSKRKRWPYLTLNLELLILCDVWPPFCLVVPCLWPQTFVCLLLKITNTTLLWKQFYRKIEICPAWFGNSLRVCMLWNSYLFLCISSCLWCFTSYFLKPVCWVILDDETITSVMHWILHRKWHTQFVCVEVAGVGWKMVTALCMVGREESLKFEEYRAK